MVRRDDEKPVEDGPGLQRLLRRAGSAVAAGLVGFAVGSETLGSISSPATRNGVTELYLHLRASAAHRGHGALLDHGQAGAHVPQRGRLRAGAGRHCGPDGADATVRAAPFRYDARTRLADLRVGYFRAAFERDEKDYPNKRWDLAALDVLRAQGATLVPVEVPEAAYGAMRLILTAEAAAAFDELTRSGRDDELTAQGPGDWPNTFRTARLIPAVDYINANRVRTLAMRAWGELFGRVDVVVAPTSGTQLVATNLTGRPAVILPSGFRDDGTPVSITFLGGLFEEGKVLAAAGAYQRATEFHLRHPAAVV